MEKYTYLLVNFCTVIICFIFSFHPKIRFDRHFMAFLKASALVAIPFILGDAYFTKIGVWWFRDDYLIGIRLLGLPIEEWLFFICIPFSCIFTYFCLDKFFKLQWNATLERYFSILCILICLAVALLNQGRIYTFITFSTTAILLFALKFIARVNWIGKLALVYSILMIPFFLVNGMLTGTAISQPIVNYNPLNFMGIRIGTVPLEDAVYGYELIALNLFFFRYFINKEPVWFFVKNWRMKKSYILTGVIGLTCSLASCASSIPKHTRAVQHFDVNRYLGNWYEIARFDYVFERNMNNTTAKYSLNADGSIRVLNRGYKYVKKQWKEAKGKAKFRGSRDVGELKVSFFGPFYGAYNVIALDPDYRYALIAGNNLKYLWILSREKTIPDAVKENYLKQAREAGYDVDKLIWVEHDRD